MLSDFLPNQSKHMCAKAHVGAKHNRATGKGLALDVLIVFRQAQA